MVSPVYDNHNLTYQNISKPRQNSHSQAALECESGQYGSNMNLKSIPNYEREDFSPPLGLGLGLGLGRLGFGSFHVQGAQGKSKEQFIHSGQVNEVMSCLRLVLLILGRFPFRPTIQVEAVDGCLHHLNNLNSSSTGEDINVNVRVASTTAKKFFKGKNYSSSLKSFTWIYFGLTSLILVFLLVIFMGSFLGVFLNWCFLEVPEWGANQKMIFQSNLIPFVLVWSCLLSATVGSFSFLYNRKTVARFLNYWNVAVDQLDMKIPNQLKKFLYMSNIWFMVFLGVTILSTKVLNIKLAKGGATLFGILALRLISPTIDEIEWLCRTLGMFIMLYAMYASRSLLFFFVFKCKLLRYCFKEWNLRLAAELRQPKRFDSEELMKEEANCKTLFSQWCILLKLVRQTDKVFASILLSYYGSQILNMCFELYYVAMSNTVTIFNREDSDDNGLDTFVSILLLIQNIYVFLSVSLNAAYVGEEANKTFEILKTKGVNIHDSPYRRHLIQSLLISFQQRVCLTGGHYFEIDKSFIVTVMGAVFTYFIIIVQYGSGYQISPGNRST